MATIAEKETIKTLTTHYIDGEFVESHGREVMDIIKPTNGKLIGRVPLEMKRTRNKPSPPPKGIRNFGRRRRKTLTSSAPVAQGGLGPRG